jgi:hypothetical protein
LGFAVFQLRLPVPLALSPARSWSRTEGSVFLAVQPAEHRERQLARRENQLECAGQQLSVAVEQLRFPWLELIRA